jgi:ABC-2 type transporter
LFLFAGFFVKIEEMPRWISWVSYLAPTKYSFDGYLHVIFDDQIFLESGSSPPTYIQGDDLLDHGCEAWVMFGVLLAWVVALRLLHYGIFTYHVLPFLPSHKEVPTLEEECESLSLIISDMDDDCTGDDVNVGVSPRTIADVSENDRDIEIGADFKVESSSFEDDIPITTGRVQWR